MQISESYINAGKILREIKNRHFSLLKNKLFENQLIDILDTIFAISDEYFLKSRLLSYVVSLAAHNGIIEKTIEFPKKIKSRYYRLLMLKDIAKAYYKQGNAIKSQYYFNCIFEETRSNSNFEDGTKEGIYFELANALLDCFSFNEADKVICQISEPFLKALVLLQAGRTQYNMGFFEKSKTYNSKANEYIPGISDYDLQNEEWLELTRNKAKNGYYSEAIEFSEKTFDTDLAKLYICRNMSSEGMFKQAVNTTAFISEFYWKAETLRFIAVDMVKAGRVKPAYEVFNMAIQQARKVSHYRMLSQTLALDSIYLSMAESGFSEKAVNTEK